MSKFIDFFKEFVKYLELMAQSDFGDEESEEPESDDPKDAYKWLVKEMKNERSTRVQKVTGGGVDPGKIYILDYDALYANVLDFWDRAPIVLILGKRKTKKGSLVFVGLNISWYPPKYRKLIIEKIRKFYKPHYEKEIKRKPKAANDQASVFMDLYALKLSLDQMGLSFAIRTYLPDRVKSPPYCICYEDWNKIVNIDQPQVYPQMQGRIGSIQDVYKLYEDHVIKYADNRPYYLKKTEENKKLGLYEFIK